MLNNPKVLDRVAEFSRFDQQLPSRILVIERIGKKSLWTMDGQRWDVSTGAAHGRDRWSFHEIRTINEGDQNQWDKLRRRNEMESEVIGIASTVRHLSDDRLAAIVSVIRSTAPSVSATQEPTK